MVLYLVRYCDVNETGKLLVDIYQRRLFVPFTSPGAVIRSEHCVSCGHFRRRRNSCRDIDVLDSRDALLANAPNDRGNRRG